MKRDREGRGVHTKEVCKHREGPDAKSTKRSGSGDVTVELLHHGGVTMTTHHILLLLQLLSNLYRERNWAELGLKIKATTISTPINKCCHYSPPLSPLPYILGR